MNLYHKQEEPKEMWWLNIRNALNVIQEEKKDNRNYRKE